MKPFNLEEAKAGKPVCTRDGRNVRIVCFDARGELPVVALVNLDDEAEGAVHYTEGGRYYLVGDDTPHDLLMKSEIYI